MRSPFPYHPPLIAMSPVLAVYAANVSLVPPSHFGKAMLAVLGVTVLLWGMAGLVLRSRDRGAAVASVAVLLFFSYGPLREIVERSGLSFIEDGAFLWIWAVLAVVATSLAGWKGKAERLATPMLNGIGLALLLFAGSGLVSCGHLAAPAAEEDQPMSSASLDGGDKPDIFYIILDGYGREDTLRQAMGYSNAPFIRELRRRGFQVPDGAVSAYVQTELSLAAILNMARIQDLFPGADANSKDRAAVDRSIDDSRVQRHLSRLGYRTIAITTGFPAFQFEAADLRLADDAGAPLLYANLLERTPLARSRHVFASMFDQRRRHLRSAFDNLERLGERSPSPRFVVAHVLAPHPPFVLGPNGEERRPRGAFGLYDGSHFFASGRTREEYREGYVDQVQYVNRRLLQVVDRLLRLSPPPVIILQGDHGSKLELHQESLERTNVKEAFGILYAMFAPERATRELSSEANSINTFRVVVRALFGADLPDLPGRSYYSTWDRPFDLIEVDPHRSDKRGGRD